MAAILEHIKRFFWNFPRRFLFSGLCALLLLLTGTAYYHLAQVVHIETSDGETASLVSLAIDTDSLARLSGIGFGVHDEVDEQQTAEGISLTVHRAFPVTFTFKDETVQGYAVQGTVAEALAKNNITLAGDDYTEPAVQAAITAETGTVGVHRVQYETVEYDETTPYTTEYQYTSLFVRKQGTELIIQEGRDGYRSETVRRRYVDGEFESEEVLSEGANNVEMQPEIIKLYKEGAPVSQVEAPEGITVENNVPSSYSAVYQMKATGYYSARGRGSSGLGLYYGTFAVDPNVIPYGTKVYIVSTDGRFVYGWAIATDTGAFIYSNNMQVDLFYETYYESAANAVWQVNVYVP